MAGANFLTVMIRLVPRHRFVASGAAGFFSPGATLLLVGWSWFSQVTIFNIVARINPSCRTDVPNTQSSAEFPHGHSAQASNVVIISQVSFLELAVASRLPFLAQA